MTTIVEVDGLMIVVPVKPCPFTDYRHPHHTEHQWQAWTPGAGTGPLTWCPGSPPRREYSL